jgi:hypothetical protein
MSDDVGLIIALEARAMEFAKTPETETRRDLDTAREVLADRIAALVTERDALRASVHSCHTGCTYAGCVNERLRAELDAARSALASTQHPCDHVWTVTYSGATYHDCRCDKCGETMRETCD